MQPCPPGLRPEAQLLLCVAGPPSESGRLALHGLLKQDLDWDFLLQAAEHNDILPLLFWRLDSEFKESVPATVVRRLWAVSAEIALRNLSLTNELVRLLSVLEKNNVQSVPFKGPSLAFSLYGNLALRRMGDLDILVQRQDVASAKRLLIREGYRIVPEISPAQEGTYLESEEDFHFHREDDDIHVEIHWAIIQKHVGRHAYVTDLWDRVTPSRLAGQPTLTFPPEDLFLVLCIHGHKHDWRALKWIADIGWMIAAHRELDWEAVLQRARSLRQERAVLTGSLLANSFFGTRLPQKVLLSANSSKMRARAALIRGRLFRCEDRLPGFHEWRAYFDQRNGSPAESFETFPSPRVLRYLFAILTPEASDHIKPNHPEAISRIIYERSSFQHAYRALRRLGRHGVGIFQLLR